MQLALKNSPATRSFAACSGDAADEEAVAVVPDGLAPAVAEVAGSGSGCNEATGVGAVRAPRAAASAVEAAGGVGVVVLGCAEGSDDGAAGGGGAAATAGAAAEAAEGRPGDTAAPPGWNARMNASISAALVRARANLSFIGNMNCPLPSVIECCRSASLRLACHLESAKSGIVGMALRPIAPFPSTSWHVWQTARNKRPVPNPARNRC